ncbi:hypothetical protein GALMADRAFT_278670 [Galerina marginata CBS 339.88]|uniref:Uncharacterized protein n=1 Tax=Galerina marginata (strain CBS 339.88) TaxID=685588 RepID=A0A067T5A4_GALM3|nr:hypothetical protein GALMADRAFT_278670 [Galerina marginata CBS 339.88]
MPHAKRRINDGSDRAPRESQRAGRKEWKRRGKIGWYRVSEGSQRVQGMRNGTRRDSNDVPPHQKTMRGDDARAAADCPPCQMTMRGRGMPPPASLSCRVQTRAGSMHPMPTAVSIERRRGVVEASSHPTRRLLRAFVLADLQWCRVARGCWVPLAERRSTDSGIVEVGCRTQNGEAVRLKTRRRGEAKCRRRVRNSVIMGNGRWCGSRMGRRGGPSAWACCEPLAQWKLEGGG